MAEPKVYFFAKRHLSYMADTKEPKRHPELFEPMVKKSDYENLEKERARLEGYSVLHSAWAALEALSPFDEPGQPNHIEALALRALAKIQKLEAVIAMPLKCTRCGERTKEIWGRSCPSTVYETCDWQLDFNPTSEGQGSPT